jgi:hypothetical protein
MSHNLGIKTLDANLHLTDPLRARLHPDNERECIWEMLQTLRNEVVRLQKRLDEKDAITD